jgi:hypothetical protein
MNRWSLPLENRALDVRTDMARVTVVPLVEGEKSWLEARGEQGDTPAIDVQTETDTTRVHISGLGPNGTWWHGPWWEAAFWKKAFRTNVVLHVPSNVRGRLHSNAAKMHVENLTSCDLAIDTDAGALTLDGVTGRLRLATQAGRIEARRIGGALDIATSAGAVHAEITSLWEGTHRIRSNVGAVRLELARGLAVDIKAHTSMGATRVDYPITEGAPAVLEIEADVGSIRVGPSTAARDEAVPSTGPYRTSWPAWPSKPVRPSSDEEIERILSKVADGTIAPETARDLLRELGVT